MIGSLQMLSLSIFFKLQKNTDLSVSNFYGNKIIQLNGCICIIIYLAIPPIIQHSRKHLFHCYK